MANTNKNTVCKGKTVDKVQKQPSESKSLVTVKQLPDSTFEFSGGKGGFNIVERKNNALEPYGKCIWNYGVVLELIPGEKQANINGEREIPDRQKVVRGSNVPVLTSHAGLNPRLKHASSLDGSQRLVITQSKALRYQIRLRSIPARTPSSLSGENSLEFGTESGKAGEVSMMANASSPNHSAVPASLAALRAGYIYSGNEGVSLSYQCKCCEREEV